MGDSLENNDQDVGIQSEEIEPAKSTTETLGNKVGLILQPSPEENEAPNVDLLSLQNSGDGGEWGNNFVTSQSVDDAIRDLPEVLRFVKKLQQCILRQRALIHKLYHKLKEGGVNRITKKDVNTQTSDTDFEVWTESAETGNLVEDIKKAAENAVQQTGFVYEATSGMYYDYNTGYYYNAELGLYYEGNSGTYYYFDESSKSFQFHSQVPVVNSSTPSVQSHDNDSSKRQNVDVSEPSEKIPKKIKIEIKEEGECSDSGSDCEKEITEVIQSSDASDPSTNHTENTDKPKIEVPQIVSSDAEIASAWPPCLRVVVKQTTLDNLVIGSLFIVTCTGGTLGREGDHAITIPDISISKHHAKVSYSEEHQCYQLVDLGSRNGTFVDGHRVSVALRESDPVALHHGTQVRVGSTTLECHLHPGRETCQDCEPGCAIQTDSGKQETDVETREARHRSELRRLRKRFGLDKLTVKEKEGSLAPGYQDRAEERRKTIGSLDHNVKTEAASVHQSIQSNNKGFKMLSKMGWSKGQGLGKDSAKGITEPVLVEQRPDKVGLGSDLVHLPVADPKAKKKAELWKKAQKRFQELEDDDD
ncbi:angiogenic factor with G patch and FHA domains 1 isoform X1 [Macrosteles quadrilineatus]|uniref:angiogenic factor with G patch and FHA domains 1 isoform X1 n=1 Tax=Macrosteles quadrilineatus TaxID=74068 RepID=UPI0023E2316C|nr:angiogenic factor with G patch and FHA domains 1 isoform X1 [Macrosteles quadrilineatus]XP_054277902.1 angiogenic factor with G patch and FHA domains 1 isoform X1 [Macrosteles quadrilineatus]